MLFQRRAGRHARQTSAKGGPRVRPAQAIAGRPEFPRFSASKDKSKALCRVQAALLAAQEALFTC